MSDACSSREHLPGLDLIRAAAIGWVTMYHAMTFGLVPDPGRWTTGFGWMGVDLFFVLSGFLIASQLLRPWADGRRPDFGRFFTRRLLRTLPAYTAVVAIYFLIPASDERPAIQPFWQFATFTENLFIDLSSAKSFSHVWSLCVEEQFYLIFPAIVALLVVKPSRRTTVLLLGATLASGMIVRGALWLSSVAERPFDPWSAPDARAYMTAIYYPTWTRLDGLLAGVAAASIRLFRPAWWRRLTRRPDLVLLTGLAAIVLSMVLFDDQIAGLWGAVFGYPLCAVGCASLVIAGSTSTSWIGRRAVPGAAMLAAGAYSLYLTQKIAFHLVMVDLIPSYGATGYVRLCVALLAAAVMAAALYWLVERPFLRLRDRIDGSRSTVIAPVPS
jgi:peptidoglycan/LPS O-acetylase OafA/YrhL